MSDHIPFRPPLSELPQHTPSPDAFDDELESDDEFDGGDATVETDADEEHDIDDEAAAVEAKATTNEKAGLTRADAKRAIDKYLELKAAPAKQLKLLAAVVGVKADAATLAATLVSAQRTDLGALNDITSLAGHDNPFQAVIAAAGLDRDTAKRVWVVLQQLGAASGTFPSKESTAGPKIAEAALGLTKENLDDLQAVRQLGRK